MRDILFRAWDEEIKEMVYPHIIDTNIEFGYYLDGNGDSQRVSLKNVMQYTGSQDKNGKKIFESDKDKSGLIVKWNQLHLCFGLFDKGSYIKDIVADWVDNKGNLPKEWICSELEIIGNIHDKDGE